MVLSRVSLIKREARMVRRRWLCTMIQSPSSTAVRNSFRLKEGILPDFAYQHVPREAFERFARWLQDCLLFLDAVDIFRRWDWGWIPAEMTAEMMTEMMTEMITGCENIARLVQPWKI